MSVIPSKPSAAELASASARSKFPVCLSVWSSQAPGQQPEKAERETKPVPNLEQDRRKTGEINKTKKKKKQLVIGGRRGPSLRSSGCMCAHQASHGDAVNHCSAPHTLTGTHLVHLASSKHFCASSWDSCQLADCNQRARWPNAAPKVVQGFLFKLVRHS